MFRRTRRQTRQSEPVAEAAATAVPSLVVVIDDANFFEQTAGGVTVVDFWAPWCGPCRAFAPIFDAAASDYDGRVSFGKCNVDANPKSAGLLQIPRNGPVGAIVAGTRRASAPFPTSGLGKPVAGERVPSV